MTLLTSPCSCRHKLRPAPVALAAGLRFVADQLLPVEKVEGEVFPALCQWKWISIIGGPGVVAHAGYWGMGGNMNDYNYNNHATIK